MVAILGFSSRNLTMQRNSKLRHSVLLGLLALLPLTASGAPYLFRVPVSGNLPAFTCTPGSVTESTVGSNISIPVTAHGCTTISVTLKGAAGGNGSTAEGGDGGLISFQLPAAQFAGTWTGTVGLAGKNAANGYAGGNGGGYTSVSFAGQILGVAGGGGGASSQASGGAGGTVAGGGETGGGVCGTGGEGATTAGPGNGGAICAGFNSGGSSYAGSSLRGGNAENIPSSETAGSGQGGVGAKGTAGNGGAGGGGGGFFGGGGGTSGGDNHPGGGGGGGSSYAIGAATQVQSSTGGGGSAPTNQNGSITISWQ